MNHYNISLREYHIIYGIHSNIPLCCILYWVEEWSEKHNFWATPYGRKIWEKVGDIRYIPCPSCFEKEQFSLIHKCKGQPCEQYRKELQNLCLELKK